MMLNALNVKRKEHIVDPLVGVPSLAADLDKQVKANGQNVWTLPKGDHPTGLTLPPGGKTVELWYPYEDAAKLFATSAAIDGWYAGKS
jgi:hypothetical protein